MTPKILSQRDDRYVCQLNTGFVVLQQVDSWTLLEDSLAMDTVAHPHSSYKASSSHLRCATDGGMIFASTKCPPPGEGDTTCSLPFGFCYTPMMILPQQLSSPSQPLPAGVMCTTCLAYMNLYCTVTPNDHGWICALCHSQNFIDPDETNDGIFNTLVSQRVVEFNQSLSLAQPSHSASSPRAKTMILVVDQHLPAMEAQAIGAALRNLLSTETSMTWRFGLIVFGQMISIVQVGLSTGMVICDTVRSHEGFTVVAEFDQEGSPDISRYLTESLDVVIMCLNTHFDVAKENQRADIPVSSHTDTSKKSRLEILKERKLARMHRSDKTEGNEGVLPQSPWTAARERAARSAPPHRFTGDALQCAVDLVSIAATGSSPDSRIFLFTNGCPNLGDGSVVDIHGEDAGSTAAYSTVDVSRLARSCEYFGVLAQSAVEAAGIGIDVLCTGSSELGLPAYQSLVEPSAGYVVSHDTFTSTNLQGNLQFLLHQTHMTRAQFVHPANTAETSSITLHSSSSSGAWTDGCTVDIRVSSFLTSTHLIGPGELVEHSLEPLLNEQVSFQKGIELNNQNRTTTTVQAKKDRSSTTMLDATQTRIRLGRYDPLSTFSVMLRLNDSYQNEEHAFFQGIVRFVDSTGQTLVTRVTSHRLSVASDVGEYLEAIDEEVVPVLLAKEAVYRSMFGREADSDHPFHAAYTDELDSLAYDAQRDLDNTIFRISSSFRLLSLVQGTKSIDLTEEGGIKAAGSSMDFAFPPELSEALRRLYHLRRGPLLSPGPVQSADDRAEMRSHFVRLPLEDCLAMMAPSLWTSGSLDDALANHGPLLENVPPETLALWENHIIVADHWHNMFLWSGSSTLSPQYDSIREHLKLFLMDRSQHRFPRPNLYILIEADSMSRRFTSLLGPSHGDPVEHQLAHFHALTRLTSAELARLHSRFRFYDPESDPSFRKWFWSVASAASTCGTVGISLCE